jgi:hypothetical protein
MLPPFSEIPFDTTIPTRILNGFRPRRPKATPEFVLSNELWSLMEVCWSQQPSDRPVMSAVVDAIKGILDPSDCNPGQVFGMSQGS